MGNQPSPRLPQPQTCSSPNPKHDGGMRPHHTKAAAPNPAHQPDLVECTVYLCTWQLNASLTRWLETILSARLTESSRSCGWRAPRRVIRARSGGIAGGGEVRVVQARPTHPLAVEARTVSLSVSFPRILARTCMHARGCSVPMRGRRGQRRAVDPHGTQCTFRSTWSKSEARSHGSFPGVKVAFSRAPYPSLLYRVYLTSAPSYRTTGAFSQA